jgi:hypothetical protein
MWRVIEPFAMSLWGGEPVMASGSDEDGVRKRVWELDERGAGKFALTGLFRQSKQKLGCIFAKLKTPHATEVVA